jgi:hypothetical protein
VNLGERLMDVLELYRWAVQDPETHAEVLRIMYERVRPGHSAVTLREDFSGTSAESVAWVALNPNRRAVCVDLDGPTVAWAAKRASRILGPHASRVRMVTGDAMMVKPPEVAEADIISVLNFSVLYLRERAVLGAYLKHARECLAERGILVMNVFGGAEAVKPGTTSHWITPAPRLAGEASPPPPPPFGYHWEVRSFEAATGRMDCRIHFELAAKGPGMPPTFVRDAFRYEWKLWTLGELTQACREAGFARVEVWRHTYDASKGAAGVFLGAVDAAVVAELPSWTAYVVAAR